MACTFLSLPYQVRKRIYAFAHLERECPINIRLHPGDVSTFPPGPWPDWNRYCEFSLRKDPCTDGTWQGLWGCNCPETPKQLLLLNKALHKEVEAILYGENKFVVRAYQPEDLKVLAKLSNDAIRALRHLLVRLNSRHCDHGHYAVEACNECFGRDTFQIGDLELFAHDENSKSMILQWSAVCSRLAPLLIPGRLTFELICNISDAATSAQVLKPLHALPRLKNCALRLGWRQDTFLRSLAQSTAARLTTGIQDTGTEKRQNSLLRSLPLEILLQIFSYAGLTPDGGFHPGWNDIVVRDGKFVRDRLVNVASHCCLKCSFTKMDCSCPLLYASYSSSCECRVLPLGLMLANRGISCIATEVLYSTNMFTFSGPIMGTLKMLRSIRVDTLRFFRRITFKLRSGEAAQWDPLRATWLPLVSYIGRHFDTSRLLLVINCGQNWNYCISGSAKLLDLYHGYRILIQGIKSAIPGLLDFHLTLGAFVALEPVWEKDIMGHEYDSTRGNRYSKRGHSAEIRNLPDCCIKVPVWHNGFNLSER